MSDAVPTGTVTVANPAPKRHVMVCPTDGGPVGQAGAADAVPASANAAAAADAAASVEREGITGVILMGPRRLPRLPGMVAPVMVSA